MTNRSILTALLAASALAIAGCQQPSAGDPGADRLTSGTQTVSIHQLASLLALSTSDSASTHVTLKNAANTVMIFTYTGGKVYVNTKSIGSVGEIERTGGQIYVSKSLVSRIRSAMRVTIRPTARTGASSGCVVIDAGHGGKDPGAISCLGFHEKTVNLAVASKVADLLRRRGLKVVMTRGGDTFIELEQRAAVANTYRADLFVSIHADSSPSSSTRGFTMYVARSASWSSRRAAGAIARSMGRTGLDSRGTQKADFRVLVKTRGPAVLIELGFLSNDREARLLRDNSFQNRLAQAIANGITDFLG